MDWSTRFQPGSRWGTAVSVAPTRVTAPWKCSNTSADIGRRDGLESLDRNVDSGVRQTVGETRQPVVERAGREAFVEEPVHDRIGHPLDLDVNGCAPLLEGSQVSFRLLRLA